ncbi:asparagine synthase (glutamine-hydrolyzing) [Thalassotalea nanhaiensis]|uniref:asparagine synthase (glutamine-hydrolyzing) n=1 Tax=Thalassotalea nanhaiensis TaxID=3065648 RepID=A0ABY9TI15_9GAMM|nr:asparagine synthase (glutamine-hydrolyzing) [Colwelliaceae bacterium SQ345]
MCGIVAIFNHDIQYEVDLKLLNKMNNSQNHRGPDDSNIWQDDGNKNIALAHTRLSIIDIEGGRQPLFDDTQTIGITFNGEIYNYIELRAELREKGYVFNTESDTEVIVNAWLEWHADCVKKLQGMFAFVLWDKKNKHLFAARDRLGIKPLHYSKADDQSFLFSSEIKALKCNDKISLALNSQAIEDYFSLGYILEPKSIYKSIYKILPGHYILLDQNKPEQLINKCYWDPLDYINVDSQNFDQETVQLKLNEAIKKHLIADVPLGVFLSGGVDSSALVALISQIKPEPVTTCSIGFDLLKYDESYYAEQVAKYFNTTHFETNVSVNDLSLVANVIDVFDEPFADNSAIPTLILSKTTREKVKVALSGDGSDELFLGYRNYQMLQLEERFRGVIPGFIRKPFFSFLAKIYPKLDRAPRFLRAKSTFQALVNNPITSFHRAMSIINSELLQQVYSYQFKEKLAGYSSEDEFKLLAKQVNHLPTLKQIQYIDFKTYLPGDILTKADRASMANSLEVRVPFLDHKIVEWGLGLAPKLNLRGSKVKQVLVKSLKGLVPEFVLERKKMSFTSPLDEWMRQIPIETLENKIFTNAFVNADIFNISQVKSLIEEHQNRQQNHGVFIWALLIFEAFLSKEESL